MSIKKVFAEDGISGLIGGLAIAVGVVVLGAVISERPRRRAEVAATLGIPVELSLGRYRSPRWMRQWRLRWHLKRPSAELQMVERRLWANLEAAPGSALAVVPVGPEDVAALGVALLARSLVSEGKRVVVADMADGRPMASLLGVRGKPGSLISTYVKGQELILIVAPGDPAVIQEVILEDTDAVIVLASVNASRGAHYLSAWVESAVVVVTGGAVTATYMASSTQLLHDAGVRIRSAILVGSDPDDHSAGTFAETVFSQPSRHIRQTTGDVLDARHGERA